MILVLNKNHVKLLVEMGKKVSKGGKEGQIDE